MSRDVRASGLVDRRARALARLRVEGRLAATAFGNRKGMEALFSAGVLAEEPAGNGRVVVVRRPEGLARFIATHYPDGLAWTEANPSRGAAARAARDSKKGSLRDMIVVLRGAHGRVEPPPEMGGSAAPFYLGSHTHSFAGCLSVRLGPVHQPVLRGIKQLAVVENLESFLSFETTGVPATAAVYAATGRLSDIMIDWLATTLETGVETLWHCGDYDPVGLSEYLRLRRISDRVRLFVPENIEELFKYSKPSLFSAQHTGDLSAWLKSPDADLRRVAELISRHGAGLEQEVLLQKGS